jgi:hypothetical protein
MLKVDEFESAFRSSIKDTYQHQDINIKSVLLVTDLDADATEKLLNQVRGFCQNLKQPQNIDWNTANHNDFKSAKDLLEIINHSAMDLIVTYRNLYSETWRYPYSLGEHLDVMLQKTEIPVLVVPHPKAGYARNDALNKCNSVVVITDHMVNDHHLVQCGLAFIDESGRLYLSHIEDQVSFDRVMAAIGKIPTIETEDAKHKLSQQLLKEPAEYICTSSKEFGQIGFKINSGGLLFSVFGILLKLDFPGIMSGGLREN